MEKTNPTNKDLSPALKKLKEQAGPKEAELIDVVNSMYDSFKAVQSTTIQKVSDATHRVKESVQEHPWCYIGGAAAVGFLLGLGLRRCNH